MLAAVGIGIVGIGIIIALTVSGISTSRIDAVNSRIDSVKDGQSNIHDQILHRAGPNLRASRKTLASSRLTA